MSLDVLPGPDSQSVVIYFVGPGFGESQVVAFPDGRWMVIDSCRYQGACMPLRLLQHFDADRIDLLVVTHPHLDPLPGQRQVIRGLTASGRPDRGRLRGHGRAVWSSPW